MDLGFLETVDRDGPRMDKDVKDVASTAALKYTNTSPQLAICTREFRNRQATDPKDHVYGVLGLVNNAQTTLNPDYRFHVLAIFAEVTRQLISSTGNLNTLSACGHHPKLDNHRTYLEVYYAHVVVLRLCGSVIAKDFFDKAMERGSIDILDSNPLPSWVPIWSQSRLSNRYLLLRDRGKCLFRACGETGASTSIGETDDDSEEQKVNELGFRPGWQALNLRGLQFDSIAWMSRSQSEVLPNQDGLDFSIDREAWLKVKTDCTIYGDEVARKRAFRNAVVLGRYKEDEEDHPNREAFLAAAFEMYLQLDINSPKTDLDGMHWRVFVAGHDMYQARVKYMADASFFITEKGYVGRVECTAKVGDQVCVLRGGKVPFVLRKKTIVDEVMWLLVGECYVEGVMHGEVLEGMDLESRDWEDFKLV